MKTPKIHRRLKISILAAIGVVAVIFVGLFIYVKTLDLNQYADLIGDRIEKATGRDFSATRLGIKVFPGIELVAEDIRFGNAEWGSSPEMVKIKRLDGRVAIIPLLQRRLEIDRFEVVGATILVEADPKGGGNWVFGSPKPQKSPGAPEEGPSFEFGGVDEILFEDTVLIFRRSGLTEPLRLDIRRLEMEEGGLPRKNNFKLDAAFRGQRFTAGGSAGLIAGIMKKGNDWPLDMDFNVEGTRVKIECVLDWGSSPPPVQGDIELEVEDSAGLEKLTGSSLLLPLPFTLAATVKAGNGQYLIEPLKGTVGESEISGSIGINSSAKKKSIKANLEASSLDLSGRKPDSQSTVSSGGRVFSDEPFPLELLNKFDGKVDLKIDRLILTNKLPLDNLRASASLQNGSLQINPLTAAVGGGNISADVNLAASGKKAAGLSIKIDGKGISGEKMAAAMGYAGTISGCSTDVAINLSGPGASLARFMGGASGEARLVMGPGVFSGAALDWGGDALTKLFDLVNPFRREEKKTTLNCAVIRLPTKEGVITVDRSIAVETNRLNVVAAGQINLRNEMVDLGFKTQAKEGIGIGAVSLAELVKVSGPLSRPTVGADTVESVKKALSVGGALATGGLSLIGQALFKKTTADRNPCRTALSGGSPGFSTSSGDSKKQQTNTGVVDSIKNFFRK